MARTQSEQNLLRMKRDPRGNRITVAGEGWVRAGVVTELLAQRLGNRRYDMSTLGKEPWYESEIEVFYKVYDALPASEQRSLKRATESLGASLPDRVVRKEWYE